MSRKINIWTNIDWIIVLIYLILLFAGWLSIYSAVYDDAHRSIFDTTQRYGKQLIWIVAALFIAVAVLMTDNKLFLFFSYFFYAFTIFLLIAVLIFGTEVNASKSWFQFGSIQIQPAEFAKLATALALAQFLSTTKLKINDSRALLRLAALIFLPVVLILLQPDVGSSIVFFAFILVLYREGLSGYAFFTLILFGILSVLALLMTEINMIILLLLSALAAYIIVNRNFKNAFRAILIFAVSCLPVIGLFRILSPQSSLLIQLLTASVFSSLILIVIAILNRRQNAAMLLGVLVAALLYTYSVDYLFDNVLMPHQKSRINIVLGFDDDPTGQSYNINQSMIAIGSGGLTGKGFLQGTQTKFNFVPEQSTDFIFCTIGEEFGFMGSLFILFLYLFLMLRLIYLAERQRSSFARIYGYSITAIIFTHVVINIGMTIGMVPVIGIPLPFISYGGSSIWAFTVMLFIFLKFDSHRMELLR